MRDLPSRSRAVALAAVTAALCAVAAGCGSSSKPSSTSGAANASSNSGKPEAGKTFVYLGASNDPAYLSIACGAKLEATRLGAQLTAQYPTAFTAAAQTPLVNSVIAGKPSGLIISPADANAMYAPLVQAKTQGVPVVTALNTLTKPDPLASQVLADETAGGAESADLVAKHLGARGGKVAMITFTPGQSVPADTRWHSFEQEIKKYPKIQYLGAQFTDITPQTATQKMDAILARTPDVKAVVATFGIAGGGAATALRQRHAQGVYLVTFDTRAEGVADLKSGTIAALIDYKLRLLGAQAVDQAVAATTGKPVRKIVELPPTTFTKANVSAPAYKQYLQETPCPK